MATWRMLAGDGSAVLGEFEAGDDLSAPVTMTAEALANAARFGVRAETTMGELLALAIGTRPVISLERADADGGG